MDELALIKAALDNLTTLVNNTAASQTAAFGRLTALITASALTPAQAQPILDEIAAISASVVTIQASADAEVPAGS